MRKNQRNRLKDSNSEMGMTLRRLHLPHVWEITDTEGKLLRHCGQERDAISYVQRNPLTSYKLVYLDIPKVIETSFEDLGNEQQLKGQNILEESKLEEFNP
jgi:hypothetical protein